jgi:predicted aldo/keto reductase-like oxidoreductase
MQYRPFGSTGIQVSALGYGAMRLPAREDKKVDLDLAVPMLQRGIDLGINYIDTAYVYIDGTSEIAVGQAIKPYNREKLYLATKIPVHSAEDGTGAVWRAKLETSLKRFDTPYIDFILFHGLRWNEYEGVISLPGMALEAARKAQDEGLVRHICFSSHDTAENIIHLIDTGAFAGMLVQYNYLDRHNEPAIQHAAQRGMGVAIMGPVAGGRLATPQGFVLDPEGELEVKTPELALRFVWDNPDVSVALSGMNAIAQIEENTAAASRLQTMDAAEHRAVQQLFEQNQKLSDLYCTGCSYCMPCPNDVQIPENFRYMNWYRVWGFEEQARSAYAKLTGADVWTPWAGPINGLKAESCLQCGECEPKCPQNIPIIDQLVEVAKTLGSPN